MRRDQVAAWVRTRPVPPLTKLVLMLVFDRCGEQEDGRWAAWPKLSTLAEDAGISSVATIRKHLAVLSEAGVIEREPRFTSRGQTSNRIVLRVPEVGTMESSPLPPERATAQPAPTGAGGALPLERAYVRKPQMNPQGEKKTRASTADEVPDDFPDNLRPHAREVMRVLRSAAASRGARRVTTRAVALTIAARPRKPLVKAAHDCAAWIADHPEAPCVDVVSRYRRWLDREPDLEGVERLAEDGTPTAGAQPHPPGVTPLRGYDRHAAKAAREAEREEAAMRVIEQRQLEGRA